MRTFVTMSGRSTVRIAPLVLSVLMIHGISGQSLGFLHRFIPQEAFKAVPFAVPTTGPTDISLTTGFPVNAVGAVPVTNGLRPSGPVPPYGTPQYTRAYETISLPAPNCSVAIDFTNIEQTDLQFLLGSSPSAQCVMTFYTARTGGRYRLGLQLSEVNFAPGVFQCDIEGIGVYSLMDGGLFLMDEFCGSKRDSPVLLTDSRTAVLALKYRAGNLNQTTSNNSTSFNIRVFTYIPNYTGFRPTYPYF